MPQHVIYDVISPGYGRRLRALLANEDYGPALVRLNAHDQQTVLKLINDNQGRAARAEITRLDTARRNRIAHQPARGTARVPAGQALQPAVAHVMSLDQASDHRDGGLGFRWPANEDNVRSNLASARAEALRRIPKLDAEAYKALAREQDPSRVRPDYIKRKSDVNPFWYH